MAITKIHPINKTIDKSIDYIENSEKTDQTIKDDVQDSLNYIENFEKTNNSLYVTGLNCSAQRAAIEFELIKEKSIQMNGDNGQRLGYHLIQSFDPTDNVSPELAHKIGMQLAEKLCTDEYQAVISTHCDKKHMHNHIVFNAYNLKTGKKFDCTNEIYAQIKQWSDELCIENGLKVIKEKSRGQKYKEWMEREGLQSWKQKLEEDIKSVMEVCNDWDSFKMYMEASGYSIKEGKYVTYTPAGAKKGVRDITLGEEYTKEYIENSWKKEIDFSSLKNQKPYMKRVNPFKKHKISRYDSDGHRLSDLSYILLLAIKIITKEGNKWTPDNMDSKNNIYYAKTDYKIQNMIDTLKVLEDRKIDNVEELKARANNIGIQCNKLKKKIKVLETKQVKMKPVDIAIKGYLKNKDIAESIFNMPDRKEKTDLQKEYAKEIKEYKLHKAFLYKQNTITEEAINDFNNRYTALSENIAALQEQYLPLATEYREIKKAEYRIDLAQKEQYVFGPLYSIENDYELKEELIDEKEKEEFEEQQEDIQRDMDAETKSKTQITR